MIFAIKYGKFEEDVIGVNSYNSLYSAYKMLEDEGHSSIEIYKISSKLEKSEADDILNDMKKYDSMI